MKAHIVTIGDEILIGQIIDTNSAFIAEELNLAGVAISEISTVSDDPDHIIQGLEHASQKAELVIVTGGLGPTRDDITKQTICDYFKTRLTIDEEVLQDIKDFLGQRDINNLNDLNIKQAEVPESCEKLRNSNGTAPGMWFEKEGVIYVFLPGVPTEMKALLTNEVIPRIKKRYQTGIVYHKTVHTQGSFEAVLANLLKDWENNLPENLKVAYLPSAGIIRIRLSMTGTDEVFIKKEVEKQIEKLHEIIPELIFGYDGITMEEVLGILLKEKDLTISTAESCTGGNIARMLTSIPGSSEYFKGSVVAYCNDVKETVLGVNKQDMINNGAVSQTTVEQMALGVKKLMNSDVSIATSGVAGPGGGSKDKPVGTTWIAIAMNDQVYSYKYRFGERRDYNIRKASLTGLNLIRKALLDLE